MISPMPGASTSIAATVLAVVVLPHVERLDVLRVVHHDDRALDDLLGEEALVLGCRSMPHDTGNSNFLPLPSRALDRVAVVHALEGRLDERSGAA
jgi:hypothetical protein